MVLDYVFYRIYMYMKKNKEAPVATAALVITGFLFGAFPMAWMVLPYLVFGWEPKSKSADSFIVFLIGYLCIYPYYKKKEKKIIEKYECSKYNRKIPYWTIPLGLFIITIVALFLQIPIHRWLEDNHYEGVVGKWLLGLFQ